jgi:probable rRNA maturation factor
MATTLELNLSFATPRGGIPTKASLHTWLQAAFDAAKPRGFARNAGVSIRFVDAPTGQGLNLQYRGRDYATNVLSFPAEIPPGLPKSFKRDWLGDLIVCAPIVESEARAQGKRLRHHYAHMCVHGLLHLLGFEHEQTAEAERMEELEAAILANFAIANPYV